MATSTATNPGPVTDSAAATNKPNDPIHAMEDNPIVNGSSTADGRNLANLFQWRSRSSWRTGVGSSKAAMNSSTTSVGGGGAAPASNSSSGGNGAISAATPPSLGARIETSGNNNNHHQQGSGGRPPRHSSSNSSNNLHGNPRRISKIRHRSSTASTSSPATAKSSNSANVAESSTSSSAAPSSSTSDLPNNSHSSTTTTSFPLDMESPVLSFWGPDLVPLPQRFSRIKQNLISGHEAALEVAWARLIAALRAEVEHIEGLGSHLIPSIEFADVDDSAQTARFGRDLKRYGIGVIRGVVPRADADRAVAETMHYMETNHDSKPPPLPQDPTCFDFFWTPAQVRTRAHPSVLKAQRYMMGLWGTNVGDQLVTKYPISYADRIRIHSPKMVAGSPEASTGDLRSPNGLPKPRSADDWFSAIQSSGVIAQVDNGSLERWEPDGYQRGGTYSRIFTGNWEEYDPWECAGRPGATSDLYNGYAACSIFRMFQGLVALSTIEPGMIRLLPSPKLATAYFLLRPFFSPRTSAPQTREGPEWESYLAPENWALDREQNRYVHGAVPGHAQRVTELWHPHLQLRRSMITLPTLQSGDYIFWHPDLAYHITSNGAGLRSPITSHPDEVSMLVYVPAAPLTQTNALYLARQRKAFLRGQPAPDFDSTGTGLESEAPQSARLGEEDVRQMGGEAALQAMGLAPWEMTDLPMAEDNEKKAERGEDGDVKMDDLETKSLNSNSSTSPAEAEVIRLANIILFPDKAIGLGF